MSYSNMRSALSEYHQVGVQGGVMDADPHRLIQMLFEGALARVATAKGQMANGDLAGKGQNISSAISIIDGLRGMLNHEVGGEIAGNLDRLYEYMERRLVEANTRNDSELLDEVTRLLQDIKSGWDGIAEEVEHPQHVAVSTGA